MEEFFIVQIDRRRYSKSAKIMNELGGVEAGQLINDKTQSFIDNANVNGRVVSRRGDDAIVLFETAEDAHNFAEAVHKATIQDNLEKSIEAQCWFRIGCAFGQVIVARDNLTGDSLTVAARLHKKAELGEFWIDATVYSLLPPNLACKYNDLEKITVDDRSFSIHRLVVIPNLGNHLEKAVLMLPANIETESNPRWKRDIAEIRGSLAKSQDESKVFKARGGSYISQSELPIELRRFSPHIIHSAQYIDGGDSNLFDFETNQSEHVSNRRYYTANFLGVHAQKIKCVILCGYYSLEQIREISQYIEFVISVAESIGEEHISEFLEEFYYRIITGWDIERSYERGCKKIEKRDEKNQLPQIFRKNEENRRRNLEEQLNSNSRKIGEEPENYEIRVKEGDILYQLELYEKAACAYKKALEIDDRNYKIWWKKSKSLARANKHTEAEESYEKTLLRVPSPPDNYVIHREYAMILDKLEKSHESIQYYKASLSIQPNYRIANHQKKKLYKKIFFGNGQNS